MLYNYSLRIINYLGELTVFCLGPSPDWPALSELKEDDVSWGNEGGGSGVFTLIVRAQDVGTHKLYIRYNGQDVTGGYIGRTGEARSVVE